MQSPLDTPRVLSNFDRAARHYEAHALLQKEIGNRLLARLPAIKINPQHIVDLGCSTGRTTRQLAGLYPKAQVTGIDFAPNMIASAKEKAGAESYLCENATHTSLANQSVDLIFANLLFPWCEPTALIKECFRLLHPQGLFLFTSLGPDTLYELRAAFKKVDTLTHVNSFIDMHHIGDCLLTQGFKDPVTDLEYLTATYPDLIELLYSLKLTGGQNANLNRPRGLMARASFEKLIEIYETFRNEDNHLPATFEVIYGQAWQADLSQQQRLDAEGNVRIPVSHLYKNPSY
jgi:malonyl-CoA O-methyltransferase